MENVTSDSVAVLFLDLQDHIVGGAKTIGRHKLRRAAGTLAKLCALHGLPAFLSSVPPGGAFLKSVTEALDDPQIRPRTYTTAFADAQLVADLTATGRKVVVIAGVASEIVVLRTALDAAAAGFDVQIAIDACGILRPYRSGGMESRHGGGRLDDVGRHAGRRTRGRLHHRRRGEDARADLRGGRQVVRLRSTSCSTIPREAEGDVGCAAFVGHAGCSDPRDTELLQ